MATLPFNGFWGLFPNDEPDTTLDSSRARDFAQRAYDRTGGATQDLRRVYDLYAENETSLASHSK